MDYKNNIGSHAFCVNKFRRAAEGTPPCFECEDRYAKCHSECEKYKEWERVHKENHEERAKEKRTSAEAYARKKEAVERYYRREGKWRN